VIGWPLNFSVREPISYRHLPRSERVTAYQATTAQRKADPTARGMIPADPDRKCIQLGECDVAFERRLRAQPRDIRLGRAAVVQLPSRGRLTEASRTTVEDIAFNSSSSESGECRYRGEVLTAARFATQPIHSLLILLGYYSARNSVYCSASRANRRRVGSS